ncbi:hypothetical protein [uncultured Sunxiuqinia sp.]|uniref:hypothetical protein n=1 Tax=uncultured Sunxiuqinia sp. TaxID=1573825 RepID=UPI0030DAAE57
MNQKIDCFISFCGKLETQHTISQLKFSELVQSIFVLSNKNIEMEGAETLLVNHPNATKSIELIARKATAGFVMVATQPSSLGLGQFAMERMLQLAESSQASMLYADYFELTVGVRSNHPVIDYQQGSLRDDFNFGPVQLFRREVLEKFVSEKHPNYQHAGFYSLRLLASRMGGIIRVPEFLFSMTETDTRQSGRKAV